MRSRSTLPQEALRALRPSKVPARSLYCIGCAPAPTTVAPHRSSQRRAIDERHPSFAHDRGAAERKPRIQTLTALAPASKASEAYPQSHAGGELRESPPPADLLSRHPSVWRQRLADRPFILTKSSLWPLAARCLCHRRRRMSRLASPARSGTSFLFSLQCRRRRACSARALWTPLSRRPSRRATDDGCSPASADRKSTRLTSSH